MGASESIYESHPDFERATRDKSVFIKDNICNLKNFKDVHIVSKDSASNSVIASANYIRDRINYPVVIKAFLDPASLISNPRITADDISISELRLMNEVRIYLLLIRQIVRYKICPCFINVLGFDQCKEFMVSTVKGNITNENNKLLIKELDNILEKSKLKPQPNDIMFGTINILVLEKATDSTTFSEYLRGGHFNGETLIKIFIQILYTLHIMKKYKIVHNDLHIQNLFIKKLSQPRQLYLAFGSEPEKILTIKTHFLVKFFDWDRSYVDQSNFYDEEFILDYNVSPLCKYVGECYAPNYKRDLYLIMCNIKSFVKRAPGRKLEWFLQFFERNVSKGLEEQQMKLKDLKKHKSACKINNPNEDDISGVYIPEGRETNSEIWMNDIDTILEKDPVVRLASLARRSSEINTMYRNIDSNNLYTATAEIRSEIMNKIEELNRENLRPSKKPKYNPNQ